MENVTLSTNPCTIKIHETPSFPCFDFLLYHGFSYFYYGDRVEYLIENGGNDKTNEVMKFLLSKRHLAPTHNSNLYIPDKDEDFLIIDEVPDFFLSGHVHKVFVDQYKHITLLVGSCWQSKSLYEEKLGREPEIGRVPIVNLQTRDVRVFNFDQDGH